MRRAWVAVRLRPPQGVLDVIVEAYVGGATAGAAGALFGKTQGVCLDELKRRGIPARKDCSPPHGHNKTSVTVLDAIVKAYLGGKSAKEASASFCCDQSVCLRELKRRGIPTRPLPGPLPHVIEALKTPKDALDGMVSAYLQGKPASEAAALFGRNKSVCLRELKRRGITAQRRPTPADFLPHNRTRSGQLDAMVALYLSGKSAREAALVFGKAASVCQRELKRRGIDARPKKNPSAALDRMIDAYICGKTTEEAARLIGRTGRICTDELKRRGIPARKRVRGDDIASTWRAFIGGVEYKKWRTEVFRRDDFTCSECGQRGCKLQAHHIFKKAKFPYMALEVANGITLCRECHTKVNGKEHQHTARYLAKIGSTIAPLVLFDKWPDKSNQKPKARKAKQLSLW